MNDLPLRIAHRDPGLPFDTCGCCGGIRPLTPLQISNRPNLPQIVFRSGDHARHKAAMLAGLSSSTALPLAGLGTRDDSDFSIALIDAWASALEVLGFYQERLINESYIGTATERFSIGELARLVGYRLHPGAAAETDMILLMDDPPGAEPDVATLTVPKGTRIQSQPGPGETAQVFETIEELEARVAWNRLRPRQTELVIPGDGDRVAWVQGTPPLAKGDVLLFVGIGRQDDHTASDWNVRRLLSAEAEADGARTRIEWDTALSGIEPEGLQLLVLRERASLFGHNAPDPRVFSEDQLENFGLVEAVTDGESFRLVEAATDDVPAGEPADLAVQIGDWDFAMPYYNALSEPDIFNGMFLLDAIYPSFVSGGWVVLSARQGMVAPFRILNAWDDGLTAYAISGKATAIEPDAPNGGQDFKGFYRSTSVWGASETLGFAERAIPTFVTGTEILLDRRVEDMSEGHRLALRGPRARVRLTTGTVTLTSDSDELRQIPAGYELMVISVQEIPFIINAFFLVIILAELGEIFTANTDGVGGGIGPGGGGNFANVSGGGGGGPGSFGEFGDLANPEAEDSGGGLPVLLQWTLQDADGFTGTVSTLPGAFLTVPAYEDDPVVAEIALLQRVEDVSPLRSRLVFNAALTHVHDRAALAIHGNVAKAAHGEAATEILGAGDPAVPFQKFVLGQAPVTHRLASTSTGVDSTLSVRVDGVEWQEMPDIYDRGAEAQVFRTVLTDDGQTIVEFGDGVSGARPSPGQDNIVAQFSRGLGRAGNLRAGQLAMPLDRPLGLREAFNPLPATGGADPEAAEDARRNVPLYTLTLGRVVSITDYRDFALGFPGIAKAESRWVWNGVNRRVVVTVAGDDGIVLPTDGATFEALLGAYREFGDPLVGFDLIAYAPTYFRVALKVSVEPAHDTDTILAHVQAQLRDDFAFEARDFAQELTLSEIAASAHKVTGVRAVDIDRLYRDTGHQTQKKVHDRLVALPGRKAPDLGLLPAEILTLSTEPFDWLEVMP
ncbi:baseplate J/gp47 family protein [Ruegeria arenilitoris]|uniref:baseplate J/gp47 family protein n=1 Tax=Ruegeria arenilitoris TaxID=1173585 RepID=UPI0014801425|nr:baseplate J/gp47 family protein [Ruegeria arenilitoris]